VSTGVSTGEYCEYRRVLRVPTSCVLVRTCAQKTDARWFSTVATRWLRGLHTHTHAHARTRTHTHTHAHTHAHTRQRAHTHAAEHRHGAPSQQRCGGDAPVRRTASNRSGARACARKARHRRVRAAPADGAQQTACAMAHVSYVCVTVSRRQRHAAGQGGHPRMRQRAWNEALNISSAASSLSRSRASLLFSTRTLSRATLASAAHARASGWSRCWQRCAMVLTRCNRMRRPSAEAKRCNRSPGGSRGAHD
jgi:hypothetical protein